MTKKLNIDLDFSDKNSVLDSIHTISIAVMENSEPDLFIDRDYNNSESLKELQKEMIQTALTMIRILKCCEEFNKMDIELKKDTIYTFGKASQIFNIITTQFLNKCDEWKKKDNTTTD